MSTLKGKRLAHVFDWYKKDEAENGFVMNVMIVLHSLDSTTQISIVSSKEINRNKYNNVITEVSKS